VDGTGYEIATAARLSGMSVARVRALIQAGVVRARLDDRGKPHLPFHDVALLRRLSRLPPAISPGRIGAAAAKLGDDASRFAWEGAGRRLWLRDDLGAFEPESGQQLLAFTPPAGEAGDRVVGLRASKATAMEAEVWVRRGRALEGRDPSAACEAYRRAIELDPDHADANINLGRLVHESGQADAAADLYRAALKSRPGDVVAWFNLGVALGDVGDLDAALACYRRVLAEDPACADAHFNAARLCERRGDRLGTVRHLRAYRALL
jgi:tetratricopeptide (TPR) repeat protein